MKIICLSTLDKFSRFYIDIANHANKKTPVTLKIYSIHFSGFLYTLIRFKFSSWITIKAWFLVQKNIKFYSKILKNEINYKGIDFNEHLKFHINLNKKISVKSLQLQALAYIDIFEKVYRNTKPDYIISIGDTRLSIQIAVALAKQKNIQVYYIEQGPFSTTIFDDVGVNANLSIRHKLTDSIEINSLSDLTSITKSKKYLRSPIYRGFDILLMKLFERTTLYPPDLKFTDLNSYKSKRSKIEHINTNNKIALLILQVPLDVNMIYHSPLYKSHLELLQDVYTNLPKEVKLVVREHPLYINKYHKTLYDYITNHNITLQSTTPLDKALDNAKFVIVNNSTVGIEAIFKYKPVVVLGNAFYDNDSICLKLKNKSDLKTVMKTALEHKPDKTQIDNFKQLLYNTVLLEGSITDRNLKSSKYIANHLVANY